jgi:hypothetical protein
LGEFLKVEESCGILSTFRSYLRILVEIDSNKPLKPGFDSPGRMGMLHGLVSNMRDLMSTVLIVACWGINNSSALPLNQQGFLKGTSSLSRSPSSQTYKLFTLLFTMLKVLLQRHPPD